MPLRPTTALLSLVSVVLRVSESVATASVAGGVPPASIGSVVYIPSGPASVISPSEVSYPPSPSASIPSVAVSLFCLAFVYVHICTQLRAVFLLRSSVMMNAIVIIVKYRPCCTHGLLLTIGLGEVRTLLGLS